MDFSQISALLTQNPAYAIPLLFAGGVLTSLTPCVYPMIPITAAIVGGAEMSDGLAPGSRRRRFRPLGLTLVYVTGLALLYSALGVFAGMTGTMFGTVSTNPWLYFAMANLLLLAALVLLDIIPLRVPQRLLSSAAGAGTAGRYSGAFMMGAMSGLVAAPCSAPVMAAVLTWVSTTKSAVLGFVYLFVFSMGMCTILIGVGVSSGFLARLPRAGAWMVWVKRGFAMLMIGVAEYYLFKMGQLVI